MSKLEEMKARAERATEARLKFNDSEDETQDEALSIRAAFVAEQSSYDVPKLIAALEAVLRLHQESDGDYRDFTDQQWQGKHCEACRDEWPCDTAETIAEALQ